MDKILAQYHEDLLRAQYKVSEIVQQQLPRGTIREDFLRDRILEGRESLRCHKGMIAKNNIMSGECDLIFYKTTSSVAVLGTQIIVEPKHCSLALEVKSNANGIDLKKTDVNFQKIKEIDSDNQPTCGLFCYNTTLIKDSILKRFGWAYDHDLEAWREDTEAILKYPNIDFIINIASLSEESDYTEKQFFLIKDAGTQRYVLEADYPIIQNFFVIADNL